MANPIRKLVQLVLDKRAATKMEADAKQSVSGIDRALGGLKKTALAVGAALVTAFGVRALIRFGKETVKVAAEAEGIWKRLSQAVENAGVSFEAVEGDIKSLARAMQDVTTVGDEDFANILTELITISGDYEQSLRNVGVVANLAAAKHIDLTTAAQLVGRAMIGETSTLKRYGIIVAEGADGVKAMADQFRGFAENEATTFQGKLKQLSNEWSDFKQAVGEALIAGANGKSVLDSLSESVKGLTEWVELNKDTIIRYVDGVISALQRLGGFMQTAIERFDPIAKYTREGQELIRSLKDENSLLAERIRLAQEILALGKEQADNEQMERILSGQPKRHAAFRVAQIEGEIEARQNLIRTIDDQIEALGRVDRTPSRLFGEAGAGGTGTEAGEPTEPAPRTLDDFWRENPALMQDLENRADRTRKIARAQAQLNSEMEISTENAIKLRIQLDKMAEAAEYSQDELQAMNMAADVAGTLIAGIFQGNIGKLAAWKAEQNAIMAAEQLAMGLVASLNPITAPLAAGHYAAATQFTAVAAAWGSLAALTGGFSGGNAAAGGRGAAGSPSDVGGPASEQTGPPGNEVHIYFVGPGFDAVNPEVQKVVYGAMTEAEQRFGPNAIIKTHRRPRG